MTYIEISSIRIYPASNYWWITPIDNRNIFLKTNGTWDNWNNDNCTLLVNNKDKKTKIFFNSKRWALSVIKKLYPKVEIIEGEH